MDYSVQVPNETLDIIIFYHNVFKIVFMFDYFNEMCMFYNLLEILAISSWYLAL